VIDGCGKKHMARGYCSDHYNNWHANGDPLKQKYVRAKNGAPMAFLNSIAKNNYSGCINWPFGTSPQGYGTVHYEGRNHMAHHVSLILSKGKPDDDKLIACHAPILCHNRLCVNPNHLRWDTYSANQLDIQIDKSNPRTAA